MFANFSRRTFRWGWKPFSTLAVPVVLGLLNNSQKASFLEVGSETKDMIRGSYENKIRRSSPLEKMFEVFATEKTPEGLNMNFFDFMKAICPFNYSTKEIGELKEYLKQNPPKVVTKLFDFDNNGTFSIYEFYMFWVFHEASITDLQRSFLSEGQSDVKVSRDQFKDFIKKRGTIAKVALVETALPVSDWLRKDGRQTKIQLNELEASLDQFTSAVFEKDQEVKLSTIINYKRQVRDEVLAFEFNTFPTDEENKISSESFAKSLVAYADPKLQNHYLSAIDKIEKGGSVSLEEFKAFKEFISDDLESLEHEIKDKGMLNKKYFKSMWQKLEADNQFKMSSLQYSIIFQILDADGDGRVSHKEFTSLLKDSQNLGRHIEADAAGYSFAPIKDLKKEFWVWFDKCERIIKIITE